jgi:hypothetical protein
MGNDLLGDWPKASLAEALVPGAQTTRRQGRGGCFEPYADLGTTASRHMRITARVHQGTAASACPDRHGLGKTSQVLGATNRSVPPLLHRFCWIEFCPPQARQG